MSNSNPSYSSKNTIYTGHCHMYIAQLCCKIYLFSENVLVKFGVHWYSYVTTMCPVWANHKHLQLNGFRKHIWLYKTMSLCTCTCIHQCVHYMCTQPVNVITCYWCTPLCALPVHLSDFCPQYVNFVELCLFDCIINKCQQV